MNRDKTELQTPPPVGTLAQSQRTDLTSTTLMGHMHDPETSEATYELRVCKWTGTPIIIDCASGREWAPSWRMLVSLAEFGGIKGDKKPSQKPNQT